MRHKPYGIYERYFKRPLDLICALIIVIAFSWLYLVIALLVRINLGSPVLFKQERPGKDCKIFKMYKFRTMTEECGKDGKLLPDGQRLTGFGQFLRNSSLDEIPEVFNIIKGEMSFIGPRPLLVKYLSRYNEEQRHRHDVRPGLSGLAQVNGRNAISWEDKFAMDVWYVDHITFSMDFKILCKTVGKSLLKQEGVSPDTSVTMEEFMGTKDCVKSTWKPPQ